MKEVISLLNEMLVAIKHIETLIQTGGAVLLVLIGLNFIVNLIKRS